MRKSKFSETQMVGRLKDAVTSRFSHSNYPSAAASNGTTG